MKSNNNNKKKQNKAKREKRERKDHHVPALHSPSCFYGYYVVNAAVELQAVIYLSTTKRVGSLCSERGTELGRVAEETRW